MKIPPFLAILLTPFLFVGCSSTAPLTIDEHGAPIAQSIGTDITDIKYISPGDFAPFDELKNGFNPTTKGVIAITDTSIYWRNGQDDMAKANPFREIPLASITGAAMDREVLQLKIEEQIHVLRITEWNRYQESVGQTLRLLEILRSRNVPEYTIESPFIGRPIYAGRDHHVDNPSDGLSYLHDGISQ